MTSSTPRIAIIGAGIAGMRAAKALLKCGADAEAVIFGDEAHRTYNRPGLTKKRYEASDSAKAALAQELAVAGVDDHGLTWRLGTRVEKVDLRKKVLRLSDGEIHAYDSLVIATGVRPRISLHAGGQCDRHSHRSLRGLDDAHYVHERLQKSSSVTIVGAGFVACEMATLAKEYGCDVVMLETRRVGPFQSILGKTVALTLKQWIVQNGVSFLTGEAAQKEMCKQADHGDLDKRERNISRSPADGEKSRSLLIEAIGSVPNTEWLEGNSLDLSDGVCVDEHMRVVDADGVFAAGDIARYPDPWQRGKFTRMEFWKNAINTGDIAGKGAAAHLGHDIDISRIAYFPHMATEMFGLRIQIAGSPAAADSTEIVCGDLNQPDRGVIVQYARNGRPIGACYLDTGAHLNSTYISLLKTLKQRQS
ncbi:FAD/NAD(P)-binding oxidoreductase [Streptomyces flavidovirens]|uniref:NAD(P)/FAD-dependent oxidoreductase n=1 Tax=Streptomyces flavidovirens TaxID=67298 RepID=UPI0034142042